MRYLICLTLAGFGPGLLGWQQRCAADIPTAVARAEQQRIASIARAVPAAVAIFTPDGNGGGSGVVITPDGYALSNFHVTAPVGEYLKCGMSDGRMYDAVIVGIDPTGDVALVKLLGRDDFPCATMGDSDRLLVGDWCFVVGNPFLLATDLQPTVTYGIVSGTHRYQYPAGSILEYADCIQTDAAINPGNSGGPLFNARGELVGIVGRGSFEKRGRVNVGVGYAISINQVKNFLGALHSGRIVDHATLGATVDRDYQGRVVVSNILDSSDAYRRGLRYGDEIVSFGGRPITSVNTFKNVLGIFPNGWRVPLTFSRDGKRRETHVRLASVHTPTELLELIEREPPSPEGPDDPPRSKGKGKPRPGGPEPEAPRSKGKGKPPAPQPEPSAPKPKVVVPDAAAKMIQARVGFKNYYFNELQRSRTWSRLTGHGNYSDVAGAWTFRGQTAAGDPLSAALADERSEMQWLGTPVEVTESKDLDEQLGPADTGILAALHLWRRLLVQGPARFGEVIYIGQAPLPGSEGLFEVLSATRGVSELLAYFDPSDGQLVSIEVIFATRMDPCELLFDDYRRVGGVALPHTIVARRGGEAFAELRLTQFDAARKP